jgi:predicted ATPase
MVERGAVAGGLDGSAGVAQPPSGLGGGKPNALTISLSPLSDEDTARLVGELLGSLLPAEAQVELLTRAGGNPLYAEEFVRMLRDRDLDGELPETVQGLIAARLDLLEPAQKLLLQDGAVLGKRFRIGGLASLSGLDRPSLEAGLHALERKEFLRRERGRVVEGESEYAFCHVLVRDVAYGQLPRADRAEKHLTAARWIEGLGRREDHAEMLAHHYLQAFELTRAAGGDASPFADAAGSALEDAGDRSLALHAYDVSARFYRAALELAGQGDAASGRLLLRLGRALYRLGEPAAEVLERARDECVAAGEPEAAIEAQAILCEQVWSDGERDAAFAELSVARERAEPLPPSPAKAQLLSVGSRLLMRAAEYEEAIRLGEEAHDRRATRP